MHVKKEKTVIPTNFACIKLDKGLTALIDEADYERLAAYRWFAKKSHNCFYAVRKVIVNGNEQFIRMHREIMNTPNGFIVHHVNGHTLDNRKTNLQNLTDKQHESSHFKS